MNTEEPMAESDHALTDPERDAIASEIYGDYDSDRLYAAVESIIGGRLARAADEIERELICCDVFERLHNKRSIDQSTGQNAERRMHAVCYWGEAARRIVLSTSPGETRGV